MDFIMGALRERAVHLIHTYTGGQPKHKSHAKVIESVFERQKTVKEAVKQIPGWDGLQNDGEASDNEQNYDDDNNGAGRYSEKEI